jgi:hypothetical protein
MVWVKCREYRLHVQHDILYAYDMHREYHVAHAAGKHEAMLIITINEAIVLNKIDNIDYICNVYLVL